MENINEPRITISDEDLETVSGGAGATTTYNYNIFASRIQALSEVITTNRTRFVQVLKEADAAARKMPEHDFETVKAKMNEVRDFFGKGSKPFAYAGAVLKYLMDCGKIVYP